MSERAAGGGELLGARRPIADLTPYQRLCHTLVLPAADLVLRQRVLSRLDELLAFQYASREAIDTFRGERLRQLAVRCAGDVPYYSEVFDAAGIDPRAFDDPGRLPELPVLTKSVIRERFEDLRARSHVGPTTEMKSSGSTGLQTTVLLDKACLDEVFATQLMFWSWGGFAMGGAHLQTGMSLERGPVRRLKDLVFRCTYTSAFGLTDDDLRLIVDRIRRRGIRFVLGYASSVYVIARYVLEQGIDLRLAGAFTWGDSLFPHYRQAVEGAFHCKVFDVYGLGEGLQCAAQCERVESLHVAEHGVIVEIVDGDGQPVRQGDLGRVVVTRLEPGAMPLIRYDTGDVAHFVEGACGCGRSLRLLSRVQGRSTDIVTTPTGDRLIVHYFTQLFEMIPEIVQFQVRQERPEAIDILYIPGTGFRAEILEQLRRDIRANCRFPLEIEFSEVAEIPLEKSNKRRFVISKVPL